MLNRAIELHMQLPRVIAEEAKRAPVVRTAAGCRTPRRERRAAAAAAHSQPTRGAQVAAKVQTYVTTQWERLQGFCVGRRRA